MKNIWNSENDDSDSESSLLGDEEVLPIESASQLLVPAPTWKATEPLLGLHISVQRAMENKGRTFV